MTQAQKRPAVLVTGATGLVGFHMVRHLSEAGWPCFAVVRPTSDTGALEKLREKGLPVTIEVLSGAPATAEALSPVRLLIHCAGAVDPHARPEDIFATNVELTRAWLEAALAAKLEQFVHVSSLSVITAQGDQFDVDESAPLTTFGEAYADSKVAAEKLVSEFQAKGKSSGFNTTILRPGFIYGPGERAWMPRLINSISSGKAMLIDGGTRATNVIYIENLCRAAALALLNPRAYAQVYNLTDGQTPTKKELFDAIADGLGLPRVTKSIPRPLARLVCEAVSAIAPCLPPQRRAGLSRFSRAAFRLAAVNQGFSIQKAEQELGYTERVPFSKAMPETLRHFAAQKPGTQAPDRVGAAN